MLYRIYFGFMDCLASASMWWRLLQEDHPDGIYVYSHGFWGFLACQWIDKVFDSKMQTW